MAHYNTVAAYYDRFNSGMDYAALNGFCAEAYSRFGPGGEKPLALDLGCGTGSLTKLLSERFDMTAMDINEDMLSAARAKCGDDVLFVRGDMRGFELYGTVAAVFSTTDCVNYLLSVNELEACFSCVKTYLDPGGIFVFDMVTKHRFSTFYADNTYVFDDGDAYLVWENHYAKSGVCNFLLTLFVRESGGGWTRLEDMQRQRSYSVDTVKKAVEKAGLSVLGVYGGTDFSPLADDSDRAYFVCRR